MSRLHDSKTGEAIGLRAHQAHATANFVSALAALAVFGLSVAGFLWHMNGVKEHRDSLEKMK